MVSKSMQTWDAESYAKEARFVSELGMPVVRLLAPKIRERILDVGCGDGYIAQQMVLMGCEVVGVDSSRELVGAAKAYGINALSFVVRRLSYSGGRRHCRGTWATGCRRSPMIFWRHST